MNKQKGYFNISAMEKFIFICIVLAIGYGIGRLIEWLLHLFTLSITLA